MIAKDQNAQRHGKRKLVEPVVVDDKSPSDDRFATALQAYMCFAGLYLVGPRRSFNDCDLRVRDDDHQ